MAKVEIYTRMMCGFCDSAKALLDKKGVAYDEIDVTFDPAAREVMVMRADGRNTTPQIFIGGTGVGGSDDIYALDREGRLDAMLKA